MIQSELDGYLRSLGLVVEVVADSQATPYISVRDFTIPTGTLAGTTCNVALQQMPAPYTTPSSVHVQPALVPMGQRNSQASALGPDWQYLSRRLDCPPTPQRVWAWVITILGEL